MLIRIDPDSNQPIYLQISNAIEARIEDGTIRGGERLPPARSLSSLLGVNMHTVLKAYAELQTRSLVEMHRGRGGVVVGGLPDIARLARQLVVAARRRGLDRGDVEALITEAWR
jgi:GntR family transcriptional regulator